MNNMGATVWGFLVWIVIVHVIAVGQVINWIF